MGIPLNPVPHHSSAHDTALRDDQHPTANTPSTDAREQTAPRRRAASGSRSGCSTLHRSPGPCACRSGGGFSSTTWPSVLYSRRNFLAGTWYPTRPKQAGRTGHRFRVRPGTSEVESGEGVDFSIAVAIPPGLRVVGHGVDRGRVFAGLGPPGLHVRRGQDLPGRARTRGAPRQSASGQSSVRITHRHFAIWRSRTNPNSVNSSSGPVWRKEPRCGFRSVVCSGYASTTPPPAARIASSAPATAARATPRSRCLLPVKMQPIRQSGSATAPCSYFAGFLMLGSSAGDPY